MRAHGGLAFFPLLKEDGSFEWRHNDAYAFGELTVKAPEPYAQLGLEENVPIYTQFLRDPDRFLFVPQPQRAEKIWQNFLP